MPEKKSVFEIICIFLKPLSHHFSLSLTLNPDSTLYNLTGLRDMGIALVCGIVGAAVWSQVAHANRRDWEQANRVSFYYTFIYLRDHLYVGLKH